MKLRTVQSVMAALLALDLSVGMGASPVIGTVVAKGTFQIDNSTVLGNATLFEGATVETRVVGSTLELASGVRLALAAESRGRVFGDRLVLEKGEGQLDKGAAYRITARGLWIQPETGQSTARVALAGASRVRVTAQNGSFRILNAKGVLVANLPKGAALEFDTQAAASSTSKLAGCLERRAGRFVLTDETTRVTVELLGSGLEKEVGNRVEVTGTMDPTATPMPEASQLVRVSSVKRTSKGCGKAAAAAGAATGRTGAGGAGGSGVALSGTTIAIIGGVAAAATVGGLAAAGRLPGQGEQAATPISR